MTNLKLLDLSVLVIQFAEIFEEEEVAWTDRDKENLWQIFFFIQRKDKDVLGGFRAKLRLMGRNEFGIWAD